MKRTVLRRREELKVQGIASRIGQNKGGSWDVVE